MIWLERKFLLLLSYRLDKFKQKSSTLFNCRCPLCNDSEKNKNRARGYFYEIKGSFRFHCHNCGKDKSFETMLKEIDSNLYYQYIKEKILNSGNSTLVVEKTEEKQYNTTIVDLPTIADLNPTHPAKKYILERKIPLKYFSQLYFSEKYMTWINTKTPKFKEEQLKYDGPRIVIPFLNFNKELIGVTGRAINNDKVRYSMVIFDERYPKIYGLDQVNLNKIFYVVEGPFDSMFLVNGLAAGSSDLIGPIRQIGFLNNAVFVFDNEPRNKEIVGKIQGAIDTGMKVVIWPELPFKDINEGIKDYGFLSSEIQSIIDANIFSGLTASAKLSAWKKI